MTSSEKEPKVPDVSLGVCDGLLKNSRSDQCELYVDAILLAMSDRRGGIRVNAVHVD